MPQIDHRDYAPIPPDTLRPLRQAHAVFAPQAPEIDYDRLAAAIVDELERREMVRGERFIKTKRRV